MFLRSWYKFPDASPKFPHPSIGLVIYKFQHLYKLHMLSNCHLFVNLKPLCYYPKSNLFLHVFSRGLLLFFLYFPILIETAYFDIWQSCLFFFHLSVILEIVLHVAMCPGSFVFSCSVVQLPQMYLPTAGCLLIALISFLT